MKRKLFFLITIALSISACCHAQGYYFRHYQVENGLSHNTVFCAVQDHQGFMWFGTKDGLNRFDGNTFKVFRHDPDDSNSIGDNFVYSLYEAPDSQLWAGTARGLYKYIAAEEKFTFIHTDEVGDLYDIRNDNGGNTWFLMSGKLYRYDKKSGIALNIPVPGNEVVSALCITADDMIWFATYSRVNSYNYTTKTFASFHLFDHSLPTTAEWIHKLFDTGDGRLLVGTTNQGIKLFNIAAGNYTDRIGYNPDKTSIYVRDIIKVDKFEYWLATESGIFIYNESTDSIVNLKKSFNNPYSLSDNAVYTLCKDNEGGMWAGTYFGGVNYYRKQYAPFQKFFPDNTNNTISGNAVREICKDKYGNLWIGTEDNGLNKLEPNTGKITHFLPDGKPGSITYSNIHGLLATGDQLWIGTFEHGVDILNIKTGKVERHINGSPHTFRSNFILTFCKTRSGQILAGTTLEVVRYDPLSDTFHNVEEVPGDNFVYNIVEDSEGTIWVATIGHGLYFYKPATGEKGNFRNNPTDPASIGSDLVNAIFEDSRHNIWLATEGGGLCLFDKQSKKFTRYTTRNSLPSNFIFRVLEDSRHNLWISTTRGLVCMDPASGKMQQYTRANGLLNDQFNYSSAFKDSSGRMYFGSVKGMISFNPDEFVQNNFQPPVYITGIQANNKELEVGAGNSFLHRSVVITKKITLPYNQSTISIDFAALSYTAPEMTTYAYMMQGLDDNWTYIKTNRKAYYTDITPGRYTFIVKSLSANGQWSQRPATLTIEILPPFWKSSWAYLVYALTITGIVYFFVALYHNRTKEKNRIRMEQIAHEKEKELYEAKIDFFTNVAHEIKTPLTLIKGPLEKVMRQSADTPDIQKNLGMMTRNTDRLINLTNQLLDFRQTEVKGFSLNFTQINVSHLLQETFSDFRSLAEKKNIVYRFNEEKQDIFAAVDEEALNKIFSNLFSNAIKYAASRVIASIRKEPQHFVVEIANDGYHIPAENRERIFEPFYRLKETEKQKGTGIGLALSRSLAILHKGKLYLKEGGDQHINVFVLSIPLSPENNETKNDPAII